MLLRWREPRAVVRVTLFTIHYRPEWTPTGWVIWRGDTRSPHEVATRSYPRPVTSRQRDAAILRAQGKDRAACTRLGLTAISHGLNGWSLAIVVPGSEIGS